MKLAAETTAGGAAARSASASQMSVVRQAERQPCASGQTAALRERAQQECAAKHDAGAACERDNADRIGSRAYGHVRG